MKRFFKSPLFIYGTLLIAVLLALPMLSTAFSQPATLLPFCLIGMAAATAEINTIKRPGNVVAYPIAAATKIYAGTLVALNSSGNALPAADTVGLTVVGVANATVDNSAGIAGALSIDVERGVFKFTNSSTAAVDPDDKNKLCYVEDDNTVSETTTNSIPAGLVLQVDSDGVWVQLPLAPAQLSAIADAAVLPSKTNIVQARTATADGLTTGIISDTATHVTVTSADVNHIITLPTPTPGRMIVIHGGSTGFELRSSAPATVAINGGSGANAESAIAANSTVLAICVSATAWKAIFLDADSDVAKVEAAA